MIELEALPRGVTTNARLPGKFLSQYWDRNTKCMKCIGVFITPEEASQAREDFIENLIKYNGKVLPKSRDLPKGIRRLSNKIKNDTFVAEVQFWYGKYKDKHVCIHVGTYDTIDEAVKGRIDFLDNLK